MPKRRKAGGCNCCPTGPSCGVFTDSFDREDSTDMGDDWAEDTSCTPDRWEIQSNQAVFTSGTSCDPALAVCNTAAERAEQHVAADVTLVESGGSYGEGGVFAAYEDDSRFWFATVRRISATTYRCRLGLNSGHFVRDSADTTTAIVRVTLCVKPNGWIHANFLDSGGAVAVALSDPPSSGPAGTKAGLYARFGLEIQFDNFNLQHHEDDSTSGLEECPECQPDTHPCCDCELEVDQELVLDVPSGLTNDECSDCPDLGREYFLARKSGFGLLCDWSLRFDMECTWGDDPCLEDPGCPCWGEDCDEVNQNDNLTLEWQVSIDTLTEDCQFTATLTLLGGGPDDRDCPCTVEAKMSVTYQGTLTLPIDCPDWEATLTKQSENIVGNYCTGSWPSSVTLRPAA